MTRMTCNVYVLTEEGSALLLAAGSTPPEWALPQLGAHVIDDAPEPVVDEPSVEPDERVSIPPKSGRGSSAAAWAAYALARGYEVDENAKASEIRAALEAEGIPTE